MAFDEEFHKLQEGFGTRFCDLRDQAKLLVGESNMWIIFVLLGITSVVLVTGILYMWYRHCHSNQKHRHSNQDKAKDHEGKDQISKATEKENIKGSNSEKETIKRSHSENSPVSNGNVRHSGSESPVKSRIPVRAKVKQT